jgi:hypothetical protein
LNLYSGLLCVTEEHTSLWKQSISVGNVVNLMMTSSLIYTGDQAVLEQQILEAAVGSIDQIWMIEM